MPATFNMTKFLIQGARSGRRELDVNARDRSVRKRQQQILGESYSFLRLRADGTYDLVNPDPDNIMGKRS